MTKRRTVALLLLVACAAVAVIWLIPQSVFLSSFVEHMYPGLIPANGYARNLNSGDPDLIRESLAHLTDRKNPVAVQRGIELLGSSDDYIWLNAAHYLGACGQPEAVPYLIKSLRHTAWRADAEAVQRLRAITGQDFGTDFSRWQRWWLQQHPDS